MNRLSSHNLFTFTDTEKRLYSHKILSLIRFSSMKLWWSSSIHLFQHKFHTFFYPEIVSVWKWMKNKKCWVMMNILKFTDHPHSAGGFGPNTLTPPEKMNGGDPGSNAATAALLHGHGHHQHHHHLTHMTGPVGGGGLPPHFGLSHHGALLPHPVHTPPSPLPTPSPPVPFERFRYFNCNRWFIVFCFSFAAAIDLLPFSRWRSR